MSSFHLSSLSVTPLSADSSAFLLSFQTSSVFPGITEGDEAANRNASNPSMDPRTTPAYRRTINEALYPATGLQLAFHHGKHEVFAPERLVPRDISLGEDGTCTVLIDEVPRFSSGHLNHEAVLPDPDAETLITVHAWQGEKHLGSWAAGCVKGREY